MNKIILISESDNVVTALCGIKAGEEVSYVKNGKGITLQIKENIRYGHKVAIADIHQGQSVVKYGGIIGEAEKEIKEGQHVHVHNVIGLRARDTKA